MEIFQSEMGTQWIIDIDGRMTHFCFFCQLSWDAYFIMYLTSHTEHILKSFKCFTDLKMQHLYRQLAPKMFKLKWTKYRNLQPNFFKTLISPQNVPVSAFISCVIHMAITKLESWTERTESKPWSHDQIFFHIAIDCAVNTNTTWAILW